jgi:hypothetical protein
MTAERRVRDLRESNEARGIAALGRDTNPSHPLAHVVVHEEAIDGWQAARLLVEDETYQLDMMSQGVWIDRAKHDDDLLEHT